MTRAHLEQQLSTAPYNVQVSAVNATVTGPASTVATAMTSVFVDVAAIVGVANADGFGFRSAWGDYDNDGDLDLYLGKRDSVNGTAPSNILYQNDGSGSFTDVTVTAAVPGIGDSWDVQWVDYNGDGRLDIYILRTTGAHVLYRNNGNGTFTDVATAVGLVSSTPFRLGATWADYDADGDMDLYVASFATAGTRFWRNNGAGSFTDATTAAGLTGSGNFSGAWADYDADGDLDLHLARVGTTDQLSRSSGGVNPTFTNVATTAGISGTASTYVSSWGDYDNDGDLDLFLPGDEVPTMLYRNNGDGTFTDVAVAAGISLTDAAFQGSFADFDSDGDLDIYVTVQEGTNRLYRNNGDGTFTDDDTVGGLITIGDGVSPSWGDYDNDGDLDLYVANTTIANALQRNDTNPAPNTVARVRLVRGSMPLFANTVDIMAGSTRVATRTIGATPLLVGGLNPTTSYSVRYRCADGTMRTASIGTPSATLATVTYSC